jgi:hypothetical protein
METYRCIAHPCWFSLLPQATGGPVGKKSYLGGVAVAGPLASSEREASALRALARRAARTTTTGTRSGQGGGL